MKGERKDEKERRRERGRKKHRDLERKDGKYCTRKRGRKRNIVERRAKQEEKEMKGEE